MILRSPARRIWASFTERPRSGSRLGLWRIGLGLFLIYIGLSFWPSASTWWGADGVLHAWTAHDNYPGLNLFWLFSMDGAGQDLALRCLGGAYFLCSILFTLGFLTPVVTAALFFLLLSFQLRNALILAAGDFLLRELLLILIFAPVNSAWSLDRLVFGVRAKRPVWAVQLAKLQISIVYVCSVIWKLRGHDWLDGDAVYYAVRLASFQRHPLPFGMDNLTFLHVLTWGTLVLESSLAVLPWIRRACGPAVVAGILFHAGLLWTFNINRLETVMIFGLLLFWVLDSDGEREEVATVAEPPRDQVPA